jgi:hypothetical protein
MFARDELHVFPPCRQFLLKLRTSPVDIRSLESRLTNTPDVRLDGEIHDPDMHGMQHNVPAGAVPNKIEEVLRAAPLGNAYRQHFDYAQALRGPMTPASLEATLAHESTTCGQRRECGPCVRQ